jgi:hypothetical protein
MSENSAPNFFLKIVKEVKVQRITDREQVQKLEEE